VSDCTLFRTGLDFVPFYKKHPFVGKNYGDFNIAKVWTTSAPIFLRLSQDRGGFMNAEQVEIELRRFAPPEGDGSPDVKDVKGRYMYEHPWAVAAREDVISSFNAYIYRSLEFYLDTILDDSDRLVWDVFHMAYRTSVFPTPVRHQWSLDVAVLLTTFPEHIFEKRHPSLGRLSNDRRTLAVLRKWRH
jgi:hypothetical protein